MPLLPRMEVYIFSGGKGQRAGHPGPKAISLPVGEDSPGTIRTPGVVPRAREEARGRECLTAIRAGCTSMCTIEFCIVPSCSRGVSDDFNPGKGFLCILMFCYPCEGCFLPRPEALGLS